MGKPARKAGSQSERKSMIDQPLRTSSKGTFEFTLVADGLYIAHKWGKNSGHIGLPLESIPKFISYLQGFEERATGTKPKVAAGKAPGGTATKGQGISKKPAKQQEKAKKPTLQDLDADLEGYQAARKGDEETAPVDI